MKQIRRAFAALACVMVIAAVVTLPGCGPSPEGAYASLVEHSRDLRDTTSIQGLLTWDSETMMPEGGAQRRARMEAVIAGVLSEKASDRRIGAWLKDANRRKDWPLVKKANLREWARDYKMSASLPTDFVKEQAALSVKAYDAWLEARQKNDFSVFAPSLERLVKLARREAEYYGYKDSPYDALLDMNEPGMTAVEYEKLFSELKSELTALTRRITAARGTRPAVFTGGPYAEEAQEEFNHLVSESLRFDFEKGRQDTSAHPFTDGVSKGDVRITTRYSTSDPTYSLGSQVHETGHGLYEQGLSADGTPAGQYCSMGIHESQSRLHENLIGRSEFFWTYWYPRLASTFGLTAGLDDFLEYYNWVQPSLIRTEADEVTYNLHILVRFEIERDLFDGKLQVRGIPAAWKQKYKEYLGVEVPDDNNGALQDMHWASGEFGYFPTYTLGDIYAAQLFSAVKKDVPGIEARMAGGDYQPLHNWLSAKIYRWGRVYRPRELVKRATGEPVSARYLVDHLKAKYLRE